MVGAREGAYLLAPLGHAVHDDRSDEVFERRIERTGEQLHQLVARRVEIQRLLDEGLDAVQQLIAADTHEHTRTHTSASQPPPPPRRG